MAQNYGNKIAVFEEFFPLPIDMSDVKKRYLVHAFIGVPCIKKRIRRLRKNFLGGLTQENMMTKIEGIATLIDRFQSPGTHSRDLPGLYEKISKGLKWEEEETGAETDPLSKLLLQIDPKGLLPMPQPEVEDIISIGKDDE